MLIDGAGAIVLYGTVGAPDWFGDGDGFTAVDVINALAVKRGKAVTVRINSGGGLVDEGVAIYNSLKNHDAEVTVCVDGVAASAASVIAMAGAKRVMRKGAMMMVHNPSTMAVGDARLMEQAAEYLSKAADSIAAIYASTSGRTPEQCKADMEEETWMTADDAVAAGYATEKDDAPVLEAVAFDYRLFRHAPEPLRALASAKGWTAKPRAKSPAITPKEAAMADKTFTEADVAAAVAKATADALARSTAITEACAAAGVPAMAAALIKDDKLSVEKAVERATAAKDIRDAVAQARKVNPALDEALADAYIASGTSLKAARADLFSRIAAAQAATPTFSQHQAGTGGNDPKDQKAMASLWDAAIADAHKQLGYAAKH